jgi:hypothetical protein
VKLGLRLSQSRPLYQAFKELKERRWGELTNAQRRAVDAEIRDFVLGGVALEVCPGGLCLTASCQAKKSCSVCSVWLRSRSLAACSGEVSCLPSTVSADAVLSPLQLRHNFRCCSPMNAQYRPWKPFSKCCAALTGP